LFVNFINIEFEFLFLSFRSNLNTRSEEGGKKNG